MINAREALRHDLLEFLLALPSSMGRKRRRQLVWAVLREAENDAVLLRDVDLEGLEGLLAGEPAEHEPALEAPQVVGNAPSPPATPSAPPASDLAAVPPAPMEIPVPPAYFIWWTGPQQ